MNARWFTRKRVVWLVIAAVAVFVGAEGFIAPPSHPVHSSGAEAVDISEYTATRDVQWRAGPPTESLAGVPCVSTQVPRGSCSAADIAANFPTLKQADHTLYYAWSGCIEHPGATGPVFLWKGSNFEYLPSTRMLLLHCYLAAGWLYFPERQFGFASSPYYTLLAIQTSTIGPGQLTIAEDDRFEHLVGDQSNQYNLATATIT